MAEHLKRVLALTIALLIIISGGIISGGCCFAVSAENADSTIEISSYKEYKSEYTEATSNNYIFEADVLFPTEISDGVTLNNDSVDFIADNSYAIYNINAEKAGYYNMAVEYCPIEYKSMDIQLSVEINGELPFEGADQIILTRTYSDSEDIKTDINGNDIKPQKNEIFEYKTAPFYDQSRIYSEPYLFYLKEGLNTLKISFVTAHISVKQLYAYSPENVPSYAEYQKKNEGLWDNTTATDVIILQAEKPYSTSSNAIYATYDRQCAVTQSADGSVNNPEKLRLNTLGQSSWKTAGQTVTYEFEIESNGFYEIGMRVRQQEAQGIFSTRKIRIDNELPFSELSEVRVDYSRDWQVKYLGDDEPYRIYLTKGKHTISFEVVTGALGKYVNELSSTINELNAIYRKIIMITGTSPDAYRDYSLDSKIPKLIERFKAVISDLTEIKNGLAKLGLESGSNVVIIDEMVSQLESFIKKPRTIPTRIANFQDNISSLSSLSLSFTEQPLEMDYIFIQKPNSQKHIAKANIAKTLMFRLKSFISSFSEDYSTISEDYGEEAITVWVNLGRDQTQIIKDMVDNDFTPNYNTKVTLSLVQQNVVQAIAASRAPDVLLYSGEIVNLAARGALIDLSKLSGFNNVKDRFSENAFVQYEFEDGTYALPMLQNFVMMFYRTDIFEELGLMEPNTWDEFYDVTRILQKNNLTVGVPVGSSTEADVSIFATLLYQNGGSFYNEDYSATAFDSEQAIEAFTDWTEFYTKYRLPQSYTLLTRFRSGEMPLALASYTTYNTFAVAAPEIKGLWKMATIPGTVRDNGTVDKTTVSTTSPACILSSCKNIEKAWEFLNWFSSAAAQTTYGITVENILGAGARYDTANIEALSRLNWAGTELEVLLSQIEQSTFVPSIPASYYVARNLTNAYRAVTIKNYNPREALYNYNIDINSEIERKRIELGLQ